MPVTWNPLDKSPSVVLSNGDLTLRDNLHAHDSARATESKSSGKWYWEVRSDVHYQGHRTGIGTSAAALTEEPGYDAYGYGYESNGYKYHSDSGEAYGDTYTAGDVISVALDLDNGKIWFAKNNVWQASGDPAAGTNEAFSGISGTFFPMHSPFSYTGATFDTATARFADGDVTYTPPSGFSTLGGASSSSPSESPSESPSLSPRYLNRPRL